MQAAEAKEPSTLAEMVAARKERQRRIEEAAERVVGASAAAKRPRVRVLVPKKRETIAEWVERQRLIPLPEYKEPWFAIISEVDPRPVHEPTIRVIQTQTCRYYTESHYCVRLVDIVSSRRDAPIVMPRHIAIYLARTLTMRSLPQIGRAFGGRDHTTILHAVEKIERLLPVDPDVARAVAIITDLAMESCR